MIILYIIKIINKFFRYKYIKNALHQKIYNNKKCITSYIHTYMYVLIINYKFSFNFYIYELM